MHLIDSNIAIHLRDGNQEIIAKIAALSALPSISIMTKIELEGGVYADPPRVAKRQERWAQFISRLTIHDTDTEVANAYVAIVAARGFVRSRIIDRLIAATAIAHGLTLVTINGEDFRDIPGLSLEVWPHPAAQ